MEGVYRTLKIPSHLIGQIVIKGLPLMLNETLWSAGMAIMMQCYSMRGLAVIAGLNISSTISNLFNVVSWRWGIPFPSLSASFWARERWKRRRIQIRR